MKKLRFWGMMMLVVVMALVTACSKDDGGGSGSGDGSQYPYDDTVTDPNAIMSFKDPQVAALCIQNFDRNNDSKLSYGEAAAVTDLGKVFSSKSITSFDELRYFKGLANIGNNAFYGCKSLTSVIFPRNVKSIENWAFAWAAFTSITIPNNVTSIGGYAFGYSPNLKSVTIPNSVTSLGYRAFTSCSSLTSVTIPNNVTSIEEGTFAYCTGLTSITIPNSVTSIGMAAFDHCTNLTSVTIGSGVTKISGAFYKCSNLKSIKSLIEDPTKVSVNNDSFDTDTYNFATLYVPKGTAEKYKATQGWKNFKNIVER